MFGLGYRRKFGDATNLLVINMDQGRRDMAKKLGKNSVVLMRGHGFAAAADGLLKLVRLSVYLRANARILMAAIQMGEFKAMSENEIKTRQNFRAGLAGKCSAAGSSGPSARMRRYAEEQPGRV